MNAPFAAFGRRPLKVFDNVGDIDFGAIDAGLFQRMVEQLAGRPNKRAPVAIFLITGLLANQHDGSFGSSLPENGLGGVPPQIASMAGPSGSSKFVKGPVRRDLLRCGDDRLDASSLARVFCETCNEAFQRCACGRATTRELLSTLYLRWLLNLSTSGCKVWLEILYAHFSDLNGLLDRMGKSGPTGTQTYKRTGGHRHREHFPAWRPNFPRPL